MSIVNGMRAGGHRNYPDDHGVWIPEDEEDVRRSMEEEELETTAENLLEDTERKVRALVELTRDYPIPFRTICETLGVNYDRLQEDMAAEVRNAGRTNQIDTHLRGLREAVRESSDRVINTTDNIYVEDSDDTSEQAPKPKRPKYNRFKQYNKRIKPEKKPLKDGEIQKQIMDDLLKT